MPPPLFINIEGTDKSGKTSQAERLLRWLAMQGCPTALLQDPGSTPLGMHVREYIKGSHPMQPLSEVMLFCAARRELVETRITPHLERGTTVITARFSPSTIAYQGFGRGVDLDKIADLDRAATGGLRPDLTLILDVDEETAVLRGRGSDARFESEKADFYQRVRDGYRYVARRDGLTVLDGRKSPASVSEDIVGEVRKLLEG